MARWCGGGAGLALFWLIAASPAMAGTLTVVHSLSGGSGADAPYGGLAMDASGNLYGETFYGGAHNLGSMFEVTPGGLETILHSFTGVDGDAPQTAPTLDGGYLLGPTLYAAPGAAGTVYAVTLDGSQGLVVHKFSNGSDGASPAARLTADAHGNLFGTACGSACGDSNGGNGTVFEITNAGHYKVLHQFSSADGTGPEGYLAIGSDGTLYGSTIAAGPTGGLYSGGTLYSLASDGSGFRVLYAFPDTCRPASGVLLAKDGSLYGTSRDGGANGDGFLYRYRSGTLTDLHDFGAAGDASNPHAGVIMDKNGQLVGTSDFGGAFGHGALYAWSPAGGEKVLYSFTGGADGDDPGEWGSSLVIDAAGALYGTTLGGGDNGAGVVFKFID